MIILPSQQIAWQCELSSLDYVLTWSTDTLLAYYDTSNLVPSSPPHNYLRQGLFIPAASLQVGGSSIIKSRSGEAGIVITS